MKTDKMHPLPWSHFIKGNGISVIEDANGHAVCGSFIMQQQDATRARQTHAFIVKHANAAFDSMSYSAFKPTHELMRYAWIPVRREKGNWVGPPKARGRLIVKVGSGEWVRPIEKRKTK